MQEKILPRTCLISGSDITGSVSTIQAMHVHGQRTGSEPHDAGECCDIAP